MSLAHVTTVAGFTLHFAAFTSQYSVPLQKSPSSVAAQSASLVQLHVLVPPGLQVPPPHKSPFVQPFPSLHATSASFGLASAGKGLHAPPMPLQSTNSIAVNLHLPVSGLQTFLAQLLSLALLQVTALSALSAHFQAPGLLLSQNQLPVHKLVFLLAQSALVAHSHSLVSSLHWPLAQLFCAQASLLGHGPFSLMAFCTHLPVAGTQMALPHAESLALSHLIALSGTGKHACCGSVVSQ